MNSERTLGDGMDNSLLKLTELDCLVHKMNVRKPRNILTFKPIEPKSPIINLVPKYVPKERKQPKYLVRKPREPKFVPYEPYKGAVEPIVQRKIQQKAKPTVSAKLQSESPRSKSNNNVEIQELVVQMAEMRAQEMNKLKKEAVQNEELMIPKRQWEKERLAYETDIKNLRETNSHLENQLKFQAQVNSELKTLLVAAVGEDLESRVQHLTEDKLQLARALLKSANHLTSNQEQTEWLSGQCEVWRSKFLASSLMVEELARWKSALATRTSELQETLKSLLDDHHKAQKLAVKTCANLAKSIERLNGKKVGNDILNTPYSIVDVCCTNCDLSQQMGDLISIDANECSVLCDKLSQLSQHTVSEKLAMKLLQNPVTISTKQDAICSALMGTAMTLNGQQMYLQHPANHATCCAHCRGEVQNI